VGTVGAVLLVIFLMGSTRGSRAQEEESSQGYVVKRGDLLTRVRAIGRVEPPSKVEVKSKVAGRILRFAVEEGERVRRGQLLAQIDATETQSQVNQIDAQVVAARANLEQARSRWTLAVANTKLGITDAEQGLLTAQARLDQARRQAEAQPELTRAAIAQAQANYHAAQSSLAALRDSTQLQTRADARSARDQARAAVDNTAKNLQRQKSLLARGFVAQSLVDAAQRDHDTAVAQRQAAEERWDTLEEQQAAQRREAEALVAQMQAALETARANSIQNGLRGDELKAARAGYQRALAGEAEVRAQAKAIEAADAVVKQLRDQLAETRIRLQDTTILAPMAGTVTKRYLEPGELVTSAISTFSSGMALLQISDLSQMRVVCQVNEADIGEVQVGQRAEIVLDVARGHRYPGRVVSVAPSASRRSSEQDQSRDANSDIVKFEVKIAIERVDERLKPGMSASVDILVGTAENVLYLPLEAVDASVDPPQVKVARDGKPVDVPVKTGLKNESLIEIRSGLKAGDRVLPSAYRGVPRRQMDINVQSGGGG